MKNAEIIRALPKLKFLKWELKALRAQIIGLERQYEQLDEEVSSLSGVTEIFEGIALSTIEGETIYGSDFGVSAVDDCTIERSAQVYTNAHTSKNGVAHDWCIKLKGPRRNAGGLDEKWLGDGWPYKEAVLVAKRWVALNESPSDTTVEMHRYRHSLDPKGKTHKRRRDAYEAAWMAGHQELAKQLLIGQRRAKKMKKTKNGRDYEQTVQAT
jgi:hypothetical protein